MVDHFLVSPRGLYSPRGFGKCNNLHIPLPYYNSNFLVQENKVNTFYLVARLEGDKRRSNAFPKRC